MGAGQEPGIQGAEGREVWTFCLTTSPIHTHHHHHYHCWFMLLQLMIWSGEKCRKVEKSEVEIIKKH